MNKTERLEATARALALDNGEKGCFETVDAWEALEPWEREADPYDYPSDDYADCVYYREQATIALAASDALLLSDAAVAKAARALSAAGCWCGLCDEPDYDNCGFCRSSCNNFARSAILAALREINV